MTCRGQVAGPTPPGRPDDNGASFIIVPAMSPELTGWFFSLLQAAVVAVALVCVLEGMRRFAARGFSRSTALAIAVGLIVSVGQAGSDLYVSSRLRLLLTTFPAVATAEPPGGWEKSTLPPAERASRSLEAARLAFQVTGRVVDTVDASGTRQPYVPSQQELRSREQMVLGFDRTEANATRLSAEAWRQLVAVIVFMGAGWILGKREASRGR
jgi:hypothetical protein